MLVPVGGAATGEVKLLPGVESYPVDSLNVRPSAGSLDLRSPGKERSPSSEFRDELEEREEVEALAGEFGAIPSNEALKGSEIARDSAEAAVVPVCKAEGKVRASGTTPFRDGPAE